MIVACPSCATRYDLPRPAPCRGGHDDPLPLPAAIAGSRAARSRSSTVSPAIPAGGDRAWLRARPRCAPDHEAAREARDAFVAQTPRRSAGACAAGRVFAAALAIAVRARLDLSRKHVVRAAPAAARSMRTPASRSISTDSNCATSNSSIMIVDGTRVLAIKGEIVNCPRSDRKIPCAALRPATTAERGEVYALDASIRRAALAARRNDDVSSPASPRRRRRRRSSKFALPGSMKSAQMPRHERHSSSTATHRRPVFRRRDRRAHPGDRRAKSRRGKPHRLLVVPV